MYDIKVKYYYYCKTVGSGSTRIHKSCSYYIQRKDKSCQEILRHYFYLTNVICHVPLLFQSAVKLRYTYQFNVIIIIIGSTAPDGPWPSSEALPIHPCRG